MRPKKKILLMGANEDRVSVLTFTLKTHAYAVTVAPSAAEAIEFLRVLHFELLLCQMPLEGVDSVIDQARAADINTPSMVLTTKQVEPVLCDAVLPDACTMELLLERIKVMSARKRGPRPVPKMPVAVPAICVPERMLA